MSNELPPLPVTNVVVDGLWEEVYGPYTADQMHAYARAAVEADRATTIQALRDTQTALRKAIKTGDIATTLRKIDAAIHALAAGAGGAAASG